MRVIEKCEAVTEYIIHVSTFTITMTDCHYISIRHMLREVCRMEQLVEKCTFSEEMSCSLSLSFF